MPQWHGRLRKRKLTGGRLSAYRGKRRFESGAPPTETRLGEIVRKVERVTGGRRKLKLLSANVVNISDPKSGKTTRSEILRIVSNPANVDYNRRGVLTRGAIIETPLGRAVVVSRPGQAGVVNAVLQRG